MGELFNAIKAESAKPRNGNKIDGRLRSHLGEEGWKDLIKAFKDPSIGNSVIYRVVKSSGFTCSYTAIARMRSDLLES